MRTQLGYSFYNLCHLLSPGDILINHSWEQTPQKNTFLVKLLRALHPHSIDPPHLRHLLGPVVAGLCDLDPQGRGHWAFLEVFLMVRTAVGGDAGICGERGTLLWTL